MVVLGGLKVLMSEVPLYCSTEPNVAEEREEEREQEREFFIDNLLVQIHFIIEMILVDRPCAMGI